MRLQLWHDGQTATQKVPCDRQADDSIGHKHINHARHMNNLTAMTTTTANSFDGDAQYRKTRSSKRSESSRVERLLSIFELGRSLRGRSLFASSFRLHPHAFLSLTYTTEVPTCLFMRGIHSCRKTTTVVKFLVLALLIPNVQSQQKVCTVCANGAPVGNPNLVIPFLLIGDNENPTCQQLDEFDPGVNPTDVVCDRIHSHSHFCGCPESAGPLNVCSLCGAPGTPPANLDMKTPLAEDTCGELDTYLSYLSAEACETPRVKRIKTADFVCGCPGATAACPMCPDGTSDISNPEKRVPFIPLAEIPYPTCQDIVNYGLLIDESEDFSCDNINFLAGYCGCPSAPSPSNACTICDDGSPVPNGNDVRFGVTCRFLDEYASYLTADQCTGEFGQFVGRIDSLCGCAGAVADCNMCPDGTNDITNGDWIIPFFSLPNNKNPTCQDAVSFAATQPDGYEQCGAFSIPAGYCGCANVEPPGDCSFCPTGGEPAFMDKEIPGFTFTCGDLYRYIPYFSQSRCETNTVDGMKRFAFYCGCPGSRPPCTLCLDGSDPPDPTKQFHEDGSTCGPFAETVAGLSRELCQDQAIALNLFAYRCDCPTGIVPQCSPRENPEMCTTQLLSTTTEECECYSFCNGELIGCDEYPGTAHNCTGGAAVIGCNLAGAVDYVAPTWPPTPSPTVGEPVFTRVSGAGPYSLLLSTRRLGMMATLSALVVIGTAGSVLL